MMRLLKIFVLFGCLNLLLVSGVYAADDSVDQTVDQILEQTREILTQFMPWSEQEKALFWPAYNDYEKNVRGLVSEMLILIRKYYRESDTLSDEEAKTFGEKFLNAGIEKANLWRSFVMGLFEILPPRKVSKLIEVERQIEIGFNLKILYEAYRPPE